MGVDSSEPNAADLVRDVRKSEMWMYDFNSLHIKVEGKWTNTEKGIADRRRRLKKERGVENPDVRRYPDLLKDRRNSLEFAIDRKRVRYLYEDPNHYKQLKIWDGNELKIHEKSYRFEQEHYGLDNKIRDRMFHELFGSNYGWPWSQPHSFWWDKKDVKAILGVYGHLEDFEVVGKQVYQETPCYVLEYEYPGSQARSMVGRWYVGRTEHLLYGFEILHHDKVDAEHWMLEYREIVPGGWFPMRTGWARYEIPESGEPYLKTISDKRVTEFHLNEPLSEELFEMVIQPYVEIQDSRSGKLRVYQKWRSLLGEALPSFEGINLQKPVESENLLICFVDLEQRPSRHMLQELVKKYETLGQSAPRVLLIQVSDMTTGMLNGWREKLKITFEIATITGDAKGILLKWGARSLPWLILTNSQGVVVTEGISVSELGER